MKKNKLAIVYDFDKTLSPRDMQEFHYLKTLGYNDPNDFWDESNKFSVEHNCDGILSYLYLIVAKDKELTKRKLIEEGKYIKLYKGVDTWFKRINAYGKKHGIEVEHYIISSGLEDIILGTSIANEFKKIYACSYVYDKDGKAIWPNRVVNYTQKTQYLYRIYKGVFDATNDKDLNNSIPDEKKYLNLENMIYFGDGQTDVPSMKTVNNNGGYTIAVFGDHKSKKQRALELYNEKRANYVAKADYSKDSKIEKIVKGIIDSIEVKNKLKEFR